MSNRFWGIGRALLVCTLAAVPLGTALAQDGGFEVVAVPWVGTAPEVPHDAVAGEAHYLQAVARNCDGQITYRWDVDGNGEYDTEFAAAPDRWNLGLQHTYNGLEQTRLFVARVEATCGEDTASAEFPVRVHVEPTRNVRINAAISNGLWYGHTILQRNVAQRRATYDNTGRGWAGSALLAQAMMNRGHKHGVDPAVDPYYEDVQWILHEIAVHSERVEDPGPQAGEPVDLNGNGYILHTAEGGVHGGINYVGGGVLEALSSWGDPTYVIPADIGAPAEVGGRALGDVVQDLSEYFMYSQTEINWNGELAGGWDYNANAGSIDSSQVGWCSVGLFAARDASGADVPDWVASRLETGIRYMDPGRDNGTAPTGGYGYRQNTQCGVNYSRSGAMLNALGFATGDRDHPYVQATVNFIGDAWGAITQGDCWGGRNEGNYYAMYQVAKGMRSFQPPFELIGERGIDWYGDYVTFLLANRQANGRWQGDNTWMGNEPIVHSLGLLVLIPTLFEAPPTAVASGAPLSIGPGDEVTFFHGGSYALDPTAPIVRYRWNFVDYPDGLDLNDDGQFDGEGEFPPEDLDGNGVVEGEEIVWEVDTDDPDLRPTWRFHADIGFDETATFPVALQVEDTEGRLHTDNESVIVEVSLINHAPVAIAHPGGNDQIYTALLGSSVRLDASASFDPDSDDAPAEGFPADGLAFVGWDLDGDGTFETEQPVVDFPVPEDWLLESTRVIQLQVCDDGTWVGTPDAECEGGDCSICRTADARIYVTVGPVIDLGDGGDAFTVEEGKTVVIDASGSNHPADRAFEMIWYCDPALPYAVSEDGMSITVDASAIDGLEGGPEFECSVTAIDDVGVSVMATFPVTVENAAPEILSARVEGEPVEGGVVEVRVAADDVPGDAPFLLYSVDCDGDGTYEVRNTRSNVVECHLDDGEYAPVVRVDDQEGGVSTAELDPFEVENVPPVIDDVVCPDTAEGELLVLQIGVSDPADPVACAIADPVPDQAQLAAFGCAILWTPTYEQALAGQVDFSVVADDGDGGVSVAEFSCFPAIRDSDGDGLPDAWEERFGTDPTVDDCNVDLDGDGLSNCDEFEGGTHPRVFEGPTAPELLDPIRGEIVDTHTPMLTSANATDALDLPLSYRYWVWDSVNAVEPIWTSELVPEAPAATAVMVMDGVLEENMTYWWTVAADNGLAMGESPDPEHFVVDAIEEPAPAPRIVSPLDQGTSPDGMPPVVFTAVEDPDPSDDELTYECQAARDADFEDVADTAESPDTGGLITAEFDDLDGNTTYWIRCRAVDLDGAPGDWSDPVEHTLNRGPTAAVDQPVLELSEGGDGLVGAGPSSDPDDGALDYAWDCPDELDVQPQGDGLAVSAAGVDAGAAGNTYVCRLTVTDEHGESDTTDFLVRVRNAPPVVVSAQCPASEEGSEVAIVIETSDPGGDAVQCEWSAPAPTGADLAGCTVTWTPTYAQALDGAVDFALMAVDADGAATPVGFTCNPTVLDGDGNGLPDSWEEENGVDDPDGDNDGDGVSNADEHEAGTDPNHFDGPTPLSLIAPVGGAHVDTLTPDLWVNNGTDPFDRPLTYEYAVFDSADAEAPLATSAGEAEGDETSSWTVPADTLADNTTYWWTARADNGFAPGPWAERESFVTDAINEPPTAPVIDQPLDGDEVPDSPVRVRLVNSTDPDPGDELSYLCEVAADAEFEMVLGEGEAAEQSGGLTAVDVEGDLEENTDYWLRCRAIDDEGAESEWSESVQITVNNTNEPPSKPIFAEPAANEVDEDGMVVIRVGESIDPDGDDLTYTVEVSDGPAFIDPVTFADTTAADDANEAAFGPIGLDDGVWYARAWAHDGRTAGPISVIRFEVQTEVEMLDGGITGPDATVTPDGGNFDGDTFNGGGCNCDVDGSDPAAPILVVLGLLAIGLRRRVR